MKDVYIWDRKLYRPEPTLCANDGPIAKLRRWYLQFYTDRAKLAKPLHNHNHEWTVHDLRDRQSEVIAAQEAEPVSACLIPSRGRADGPMGMHALRAHLRRGTGRSRQGTRPGHPLRGHYQ